MAMNTDTHGMSRRGRIVLGACLAVGAGLFLLACDNNSDPVAPADSTITVSANPQTVVVPSGGGAGAAEIVATLRSSNGTRLPDQEITFSSTAGFLDPPAETPIKSDSNGQATCILTTTSSATVMARSGSITGSTQIQTASGNISAIQLSVTPQTLDDLQRRSVGGGHGSRQYRRRDTGNLGAFHDTLEYFGWQFLPRLPGCVRFERRGERDMDAQPGELPDDMPAINSGSERQLHAQHRRRGHHGLVSGGARSDIPEYPLR